MTRGRLAERNPLPAEAATLHVGGECRRRTNDDQDTDGFSYCMYDTIRSGAIGSNYSFDDQGGVVGLSKVALEVSPVTSQTISVGTEDPHRRCAVSMGRLAACRTVQG